MQQIILLLVEKEEIFSIYFFSIAAGRLEIVHNRRSYQLLNIHKNYRLILLKCGQKILLSRFEIPYFSIIYYPNMELVHDFFEFILL